jgi:hypothetical protein
VDPSAALYEPIPATIEGWPPIYKARLLCAIIDTMTQRGRNNQNVSPAVESGMVSAGEINMWKGTKYAAIAIVGTALAVAANAPASAKGYKGYRGGAYGQGVQEYEQSYVSKQHFKRTVLRELRQIRRQNDAILADIGGRRYYGRK